MTAVAASPAARPAYFATGWTGGKNPWVIALVVTLATFMEVLDTSIANVALPQIAGNLSVSQDESTWVLTSYLVSNAVVLPISGWAANRIGRKRFYMTCVALFTIASALCGFAPSIGWLVFFRVIQGIGGGGLGPSEQSILADTFPPAKRGMAFALYGMAVVLAPAIGPTLGGFITDHYSWRWVFFINVPVGLLSLTLTTRVVSDPPHLVAAKKVKTPVDFGGLALIAVGLGALEVVLDKGQEEDWFHSTFIVAFIAVAAVALTAFVVWEWKQEHPVVNVRMFKQRHFATACIMMMVLGASLFGTTVLLPQYVQSLMNYSAEDSGMVLSPGGFVIILLMPMVGMLVQKVDARFMIGFGFTVVTLSLIYMTSHLYPGIDFGTAVKLRVFQAIGIAFLFVPINTLSYVGVPPEKNNSVSGIVNLARNMGGDIGIALVTTVIARRSQVHQVDLTAHATASSNVFQAKLAAIQAGLEHGGVPASEASRKAIGIVYNQVRGEALTLSYIDALWVFAIFSAVMVPMLFLMKKPQPGGGAPGGH